MTGKIDREAAPTRARVVSFHRMEDGNRIRRCWTAAGAPICPALPERLLAALRNWTHSLQGYP